MDREIVKRIADEAKSEEANLIIWDKRDTFTVEPKAEVSVEDEYLKITMEDGRATVYVEYDSIYKLVVGEGAHRPHRQRPRGLRGNPQLSSISTFRPTNRASFWAKPR